MSSLEARSSLEAHGGPSSHPDVDPATDYVATHTPGIDLDPARTCLVLVDIQYATGSREHGLGRRLAAEGKLHEAAYRFDRIEQHVVPNSRRLLDFCRANGIRRVFLTYGSEVSDFSDLPEHVREVCRATNNRAGQREHEIIDELKPIENERVFNKLGASGFQSTPIELVLRVYGVDMLLFAGVSTNMCVEGTMRDAADRGFRCVVVEDACGGDAQSTHDASITVLQRLYGRAASTDEVLEKLTERPPVGTGA